MPQPQPIRPRPFNKPLVLIASLVTGAVFLSLVKLMHEMTGHMGAMSSHVASMAEDMRMMRGDVGRLARQVADKTTPV